MRGSNHLIGVLNFLTFLLSIPILVCGVWLSIRANNTECLKFLQWPLIVIGVSIMVTSLAGLVGACYRNTFLMTIYLIVMLFILLVLIGFIIFAYVVTAKGSGRVVQNRSYLEYYLQDYEGWLEKRVASDSYWRKISSCVRDSKICGKVGRTFDGMPETADMFFLRKLTPIQFIKFAVSPCSWGVVSISCMSGCCKPPTECGYIYQNETMWSRGEGVVGSNADCSRWSNDQHLLCYDCDSCKAGVLATVKKSWRKVFVINIVVLIALVIVYIIAYAAYKNNSKIENCERRGKTRMTKARPK